MCRLRAIWMKGLCAGFFIFLFACNPPVPREERATNPPTDQIQTFEPVELYNRLLRKHINRNGDIHYRGFQRDSPALVLYIQYLESLNPYDIDFSPGDRMAYFINAYNAATIFLIIQHYPIPSITEIGKVPDGVENKSWIKDISPETTPPFDLPVMRISDQPMSLNEIKNTLRISFNDPRFHFALVNGTHGAPKLARTVYVGSVLNVQLEEAVRAFFQLPDKNRISPTKPMLAPLIRDNADDFRTDSTDIVDFVNLYSRVRINPSVSPEYLLYDWRLNGY